MIKIGKKIVSENSPAFLIAEAGVNHNGDMLLARKLVDAAKKSGADAVKFQNFVAAHLIRKDAPKAPYQDRNIGKRKSQYDMLRELELDSKNTFMLKDYCDKRGIIFLSTAYDEESFKTLKKANVPAYKLASIDIVCHPLIKAIAKTKKPLILSTGMATEEEVRDAVKIFRKVAGAVNNLILLQCNTNYPANPEDQNLRAINVLKKYVPIVGFSDHTEGEGASIAAIALGAKVIERHFTLSKSIKGPDHKASMDPAEFSTFVKSVRKVESALGTEEKRPTGGELENIIGMRRSICAQCEIPAGTILNESHLTYKRPGDGLLPTEENIQKLLGKKSRKDIPADMNITFSMVW